MEKAVNGNYAIDLQSASALELHGAGMGLPDEGVPEFIHLLPAGEIKTSDGRGPYHVADAAKLIERSIAGGKKLVIDVNHSTDHLASRGEPAPASGWIVELQSRADGIWGKVEWTEAGAAKVASREYRFISPALLRDEKFNVLAIRRASLVNNPNLVGLTDLNSEGSMDLAKLRKRFKLADDASVDTILAAMDISHTDLQSQLGEVAKTLGLKDGAPVVDLQSAITKLGSKTPVDNDGVDKDLLITELQSTVISQGEQLDALTSGSKRKAAEDFVGRAITQGRVGIKNQKDKFIDLHMANPSDTEELINGMPRLDNNSLTQLRATPPQDGEASLSSEDRQVAEMFGVDEVEMAKTRAAEKLTEEAL